MHLSTLPFAALIRIILRSVSAIAGSIENTQAFWSAINDKAVFGVWVPSTAVATLIEIN